MDLDASQKVTMYGEFSPFIKLVSLEILLTRIGVQLTTASIRSVKLQVLDLSY